METQSKKGFTGIIYMFIGITIAVVLVSSVVLDQIYGACQAKWDTAGKSMWTVLPIVVIAAVILMVIGGKR